MSDYLNLKLYFLNLNIKKNINYLNEINFNFNQPFSLNTKFYNNKNIYHFVRNYSTDSLSTEANLNSEKEFKQIYGGGYLGYTYIHTLGTVEKMLPNRKSQCYGTIY
jgi:hypothetical protein